jgi:hypothetical protein
MISCKCIGSLANQLGYWFRLLEDWAPTHGKISALTDFTENYRRALKHQMTLHSTLPAHFGSGCSLNHLHCTNIGCSNL